MKTLRNSILLLAGIAIIFACTKEGDISSPNTGIQSENQNAVHQSPNNKGKNGNGPQLSQDDEIKTGLKKLHHSGDKLVCTGLNGNCFDEFVVRGLSASGSFYDFLEAVEGDAQSIGDYFNGNNWHAVFDYLPDATIQKLQSYNYDIVEIEGGQENLRFFLAGNVDDGEVEINNYDFVIQLNDTEVE